MAAVTTTTTKCYDTRQIFNTLGKSFWGGLVLGCVERLEGDGAYLGVSEWIMFISVSGSVVWVKCADGLPLPSITDRQLMEAGLPSRADVEHWLHKRAGQRRRRADYRRRQAK